MRIWISAVALALVACCCSESPSDLTPEDIATVRATAFSVARLQRLDQGVCRFGRNHRDKLGEPSTSRGRAILPEDSSP